MILLTMFLTFFKIGLFSFGGGYAILAMIRQEVVLINPWLTQQEFMQVVAISQMTPGPIAINAATFVGYHKAGVLGSLVCTLGVVMPSLIVMALITVTYMKLRKLEWFKRIFKRLRLLSVGLIGAALIMILPKAVESTFALGVFIVSFFATWRWKVSPFTLLIFAAIFGAIFGIA
ncbi:MAG: chromate transporter [Candidatus Cloacimonetes bacterium]|nr:chromate transporter [Candidatus Cloacimonadota bacterium]